MSRLHDLCERATRPALWLVILLILTFVLYLPGIDAPYIGDDYYLCFDELPPNPLYWFYTPHHLMFHYRPIQLTLHNLAQVYFGFNTIPIHVVSLLSHGLLAFVTYLMLSSFGFSRLQAVIASLYLVVSPASTFAIESNDTGPQIGAPLMSYLSLWLLFVYYQRRPTATGRFSRWVYWGSVAAFAVALLTKEISLAFLFLIGLLVLYQHRDIVQANAPKRRRRLFQAIANYLPYAILAGVFYLIHSSLGVQQVQFASDASTTDRYAFRISMQIPVNIGMLLFASFQPTSSADLYLAVYARDFARIAAHAIVVLIFLGVVAWGIWRARRIRLAVVFLAGMVISYFPVFFLGQVAESYATNGMPLAAGIVGLGLGTLIEQARGFPWRRMLAVAGTMGLLALCAFTVLDKIGRIQATGDKIPTLIESLTPYVESTPDDQYLLLLDDQPRPQYSIYEMGGIELLTRWDLNKRLPHPMVYALSRQELREAEIQGGCTILSVWETSAELIYQNDTQCSPDL